MNGIVDQVKAIKRQKLIRWGVRQLISACILIPVVMRWPDWRWLLPVWIISAGASLVLTLVMQRKLEGKIDGLEARLADHEADTHQA